MVARLQKDRLHGLAPDALVYRRQREKASQSRQGSVLGHRYNHAVLVSGFEMGGIHAALEELHECDLCPFRCRRKESSSYRWLELRTKCRVRQRREIPLFHSFDRFRCFVTARHSGALATEFAQYLSRGP